MVIAIARRRYGGVELWRYGDGAASVQTWVT